MERNNIIISWVPISCGHQGFLIYDIEMHRVIDEISDYAHYLLNDRQYSKLTIEQGLNHLVEFLCYLSCEGISLHRISDGILRKFRDENYNKVCNSSAHRGGQNNAKITVNIKMRRIYDWLAWLQSTKRLPVGTVGLNGLITAIINDPAARGRLKRIYCDTRRYPLLFRVTGINAKHNAPAVAVTDEHVNLLYSFFLSRHDSFIALRNILFVDIADNSGLRRGSICSFSIDQFNLNDINIANGEFLIKPSRQKFGYSKTFGINLSLAYRIRQFIDDYWHPWVMERNLSVDVHKNHLFLAAKTGKPILERSMTQIISGAFRELGFDKGVGPHTLRGKFASQLSDDELAERLELGLDTSNMSIAAAVSMKLGHNDPSQFYRYASSSQARQARIARDGRLAELKRLKDENIKLKELLLSKGLRED